jgi:ADP-heptose:LPS heptosyltransferase
MSESKSLSIHIRMEGGLGDHLLAVRFLPAIKDKYPNSRIKIFTDTNGKTFQAEALKVAYAHLFDEIEVIPAKKYQEFWVNCQFGEDNFYGALENVPDDIRERMVNGCDKFYDLHIDGLKWMQADFDWLRYFYQFPRPQFSSIVEEHSPIFNPNDYVVMHLHSATSKGHVLEQFYIDGLVKKVSEFSNVVLIATAADNHLYNHLTNDKVSIHNGSVESVFYLIANAKAMVSTDSGFRYIAYGASVPTITFSANCMAPGQVPLSHEIRWLMFTKSVLPLNYSFNFVAKAVKNMLDNKGYTLIPFVQDFDRELVNRKYTINTQRTK